VQTRHSLGPLLTLGVRYMKSVILKTATFGASFGFTLALFIGILIIVLGYFNRPSFQEDVEGRTPRQLLDAFLLDCKKGNLSDAKSKWTPESLERIQNRDSWFAELGELELSYDKATNGKYETIWVIVADGKSNGKKIWKHFYFEVRDSKWYLHRHLIGN